MNVAVGSLTREELEWAAAQVLRATANGAYRRHTNRVTAAREARQMVEVAARLEAFVRAGSSAAAPQPEETRDA